MKIKFKNTINNWKNALKDFEESLEINLSNYPENVKDIIECGQLKKFQINTELLWKTIKVYLLENEGIDERSPKGVIKKFFGIGYLDYQDYEELINMIDDRNYLSNVYKTEMYHGTLKKLPGYLNTMKEVLGILEPLPNN
jgi:nucleotidyltransferase substrate binding protein (TIGR01987 family)